MCSVVEEEDGLNLYMKKDSTFNHLLIELVQERPYLWNKSYPGTRAVRLNNWMDIQMIIREKTGKPISGMYSYEDLLPANQPFLVFAYCIFMSIGNFLILNCFVSVVNAAMSIIRVNADAQGYDKELGDLLSRWLDSFSRKNSKLSLTRKRVGGLWTMERERYYGVLDSVLMGCDPGTLLQQRFERALKLVDDDQTIKMKLFPNSKVALCNNCKREFDDLSSDRTPSGLMEGPKGYADTKRMEVSSHCIPKHKLDKTLGTPYHDFSYKK